MKKLLFALTIPILILGCTSDQMRMSARPPLLGGSTPTYPEDLDVPIPEPEQEFQGNIKANTPMVTNTVEITQALAENLYEHKILIDLSNCIWDPDAKILYERTIKNIDGKSRLYYIAVTNVNLLAIKEPLVREK